MLDCFEKTIMKAKTLFVCLVCFGFLWIKKNTFAILYYKFAEIISKTVDKYGY